MLTIATMKAAALLLALAASTTATVLTPENYDDGPRQGRAQVAGGQDGRALSRAGVRVLPYAL